MVTLKKFLKFQIATFTFFSHINFHSKNHKWDWNYTCSTRKSNLKQMQRRTFGALYVLQEHFDDIVINCYITFSWLPWAHKYTSVAFCLLRHLKLKEYMLNLLGVYDMKNTIKLHCLYAMIYCYPRSPACDILSSLKANAIFPIWLKWFVYCLLYRLIFVLNLFSSLCICFKLLSLVLEVLFQFHLLFFTVKMILRWKKWVLLFEFFKILSLLS